MTEISPITMERETLMSGDCEITMKLESYYNWSTSCLLDVNSDNEKDAPDNEGDDNTNDDHDGDDNGNKNYSDDGGNKMITPKMKIMTWNISEEEQRKI